MQEVLTTAQSVVRVSDHVRINKEAAVEFSRKLCRDGVRVPLWNRTYHFYDNGRREVSRYPRGSGTAGTRR